MREVDGMVLVNEIFKLSERYIKCRDTGEWQEEKEGLSGKRYLVMRIVVGEGVLLEAIDGGRLMVTSRVVSVYRHESIIRVETENSLYMFKEEDKGEE